jgi:hypothetical protein
MFVNAPMLICCVAMLVVVSIDSQLNGEFDVVRQEKLCHNEELTIDRTRIDTLRSTVQIDVNIK